MPKENSTNHSNRQQLAGTCSMSFALSLISGRWKLNILSQLVLKDVLRFSELKSLIPIISEKMLTQQLNELLRDELVRKTVISRKPLHVVYSLSDTGRTLEPILVSLFYWGEAVKLQTNDRNAGE
jgi:DNA-binding HxlR family transcriptional regulator